MKTIFVNTSHVKGHEHIVDGERLARDTEEALNRLERDGYELVSIVPVIGGRWNVERFDSRVTGTIFKSPTIAPDTSASWGYSMTDGVMIVAKKRT
jgi:hypothetical protein